ncbi:DUF732 domain-containing protein [Mycobacterium simiae]|uniref:DUF732 domain-containing protein n=1 Tax=Mycobacterium simiae TaxID=1784 RepID=A0A5B1BM51_MYCSI|nr:DUF732 domain-containing protein [Mycobacterium simiae]KAA1248530.1 DUF732 domain-containing protein [Mycobacterium simiae]
MFTGTASRAGAVATATVILIGAAILRGSAAAADPNQDDQFLASLDRRGIPALENAPSLIAIAHEVCGRLDGGMPVDRVVESMTKFAYNNDPSLRQYPPDRLTRTLSRFVTAAVQAYCPFNQDKIASFSPNPTPRINEPTDRVAAYRHNAIASQRDSRDRAPASDMISVPAASRQQTPARVVGLPHSIVGNVLVARHHRGERSDRNSHGDIRAPLIETIPAGETIAPKPPQIPAPSPPPAHILMPPLAPAPSQPPQQPPPALQEPPQPQELPPPPQELPPPPQEPPPPQQVEPPAVSPQPGGAAGGGGSGDGGSAGSGSGGGGGGGPAGPSPTRPMPPGVIRVAP